MNSLAAHIAIAVILVCSECAVAQEDFAPSDELRASQTVTVHKGWPPFVFKFTKAGDGEVRIAISAGPRLFRGQTIFAVVENEHRIGFKTIDLNFDGYADFGVVYNWGHPNNACYVWWTFDSRKMVFKEAVDFSNITEIDPERQLLISRSNGGNIEHKVERYRLRNGKPEIFDSDEITWSDYARDIIPESVPDRIPVEITRTYKHGKLKQTHYTTKLDING